MKRQYVTPVLICQRFEANEYIAACEASYDLSGSQSVDCDQIAHVEKVTFRSNGSTTPLVNPYGISVDGVDPWGHKYTAYVTYIDTMGTADPSDDVAHWVTIGGVNADTAYATTDHFAKLATVVNHS